MICEHFSNLELFSIGISTSLAVLFHELPHELGDFAIVLRTGMRLRTALLWNLLASFMCWVGMSTGLFLGSFQDAWLSALVAGTFLYISLVDMVPELDACTHLPVKNRGAKLVVQVSGIGIGVGIMLAISLFEDDMRKLFP